jgi:uncharacterized glyoxalase superfamily protein PhnB
MDHQMTVELRIEVFVDDIDLFVDFYTRVLGFSVFDDRRGHVSPYVAVRRDGIRVGAVPAWDVVDKRHRHVPTGVEMVLEVDDLEGEYARVAAGGWDTEGPVTRQPWGLSDFRLLDPDGYYWRITTKPIQDRTDG